MAIEDTANQSLLGLRDSYSDICDPLDYSLPISSVHGIFQARILEWVAISSSRGSSQLRDQTHVSHVSCIAGDSLSLRQYMLNTRIRTEALVARLDFVYHFIQIRCVCLLFILFLLSSLLINSSHLLIATVSLETKIKINRPSGAI